MTKQRQLILEIIKNSSKHLSADEIFLMAKEKMPSIAVGTVYRNLGILCETGEIMKLSVPNESDRYDKNLFPHGHIRCSVCGRYIDIPKNDFKELIEKQTGITITDYSLFVNGVCTDCK